MDYRCELLAHCDLFGYGCVAYGRHAQMIVACRQVAELELSVLVAHCTAPGLLNVYGCKWDVLLAAVGNDVSHNHVSLSYAVIGLQVCSNDACKQNE